MLHGETDHCWFAHRACNGTGTIAKVEAAAKPLVAPSSRELTQMGFGEAGRRAHAREWADGEPGKEVGSNGTSRKMGQLALSKGHLVYLQGSGSRWNGCEDL